MTHHVLKRVYTDGHTAEGTHPDLKDLRKAIRHFMDCQGTKDGTKIQTMTIEFNKVSGETNEHQI